MRNELWPNIFRIQIWTVAESRLQQYYDATNLTITMERDLYYKITHCRRYACISFTVQPLKLNPKGWNLQGHVNSWIVYNKLLYTEWLDIPRQGYLVFQCAFILKIQTSVVRFVSYMQIVFLAKNTSKGYGTCCIRNVHHFHVEPEAYHHYYTRTS